MWVEGDPAKNPQGTSRFNRNIIVRRGSGDVIPEKGIKRYDKDLPNNVKLIGEVPLFSEDFSVFMVTDGGSIVTGKQIGRAHV